MADLTEDDVPGAKFVHINIEEHTNIQLKRWLKCRGLPTSGKRQDLLERYYFLRFTRVTCANARATIRYGFVLQLL